MCQVRPTLLAPLRPQTGTMLVLAFLHLGTVLGLLALPCLFIIICKDSQGTVCTTSPFPWAVIKDPPHLLCMIRNYKSRKSQLCWHKVGQP